jgi:hypothetical protein
MIIQTVHGHTFVGFRNGTTDSSYKSRTSPRWVNRALLGYERNIRSRCEYCCTPTIPSVSVPTELPPPAAERAECATGGDTCAVERLVPSLGCMSVILKTAPVSKPALLNRIQIWQNGRFRNWSMRVWRAPVLKRALSRPDPTLHPYHTHTHHVRSFPSVYRWVIVSNQCCRSWRTCGIKLHTSSSRRRPHVFLRLTNGVRRHGRDLRRTFLFPSSIASLASKRTFC